MTASKAGQAEALVGETPSALANSRMRSELQKNSTAASVLKVVLPAFYSRQDTKTPVRAGVVALVANMVFNFVLLALLYHWMVPAELMMMLPVKES